MQKTELILPGMWFTLECLPSMCKALSSSPNNVKQKQKKEKEFIARHEQWTMAQRTIVPSALRLTLFYFLSLWKKKLFLCHFHVQVIEGPVCSLWRKQWYTLIFLSRNLAWSLLTRFRVHTSYNQIVVYEQLSNSLRHHILSKGKKQYEDPFFWAVIRVLHLQSLVSQAEHHEAGIQYQHLPSWLISNLITTHTSKADTRLYVPAIFLHMTCSGFTGGREHTWKANLKHRLALIN